MEAVISVPVQENNASLASPDVIPGSWSNAQIQSPVLVLESDDVMLNQELMAGVAGGSFNNLLVNNKDDTRNYPANQN